jgi:uncharacterized repeat protein (TIGR02543 family)
MRTRKRSLAILALATAIAVALIACDTTRYFSVRYIGAGNVEGEVPIDSGRYSLGQTVTVLGNSENLTKPGRDFNGWNTEADGSGTAYSGGDSFAMSAGDTVLYAQWKPSAANDGLYDYGDTGPAGGLIFAKSYDSVLKRWTYFEAAPVDQSVGVPWKGWGSVVEGTHRWLGAGKDNTDKIIDSLGRIGSYAAYVCRDYSLNGYSDWFLPSKDELRLMYWELKRNNLGNFAAANYWTSTHAEAEVGFAYSYTAYSGNFGVSAEKYNPDALTSKLYSLRVRAARSFTDSDL